MNNSKSKLSVCVVLAPFLVQVAAANGVPPPQSTPSIASQVADPVAQLGAATSIGAGVAQSRAAVQASDAIRQSDAVRDFARTTSGSVRDLNLQYSDRVLSEGMNVSRQTQIPGTRLERAGKIASAVDYAVTGATAYERYQQGDVVGAGLVLGQAATEEGVQFVGGKAVEIACSATGIPMAGQGCKQAFNLGYAAGGAIKQVDTCAFRDCGPGRSYTIEDAVTDAEYSVYEKVKFAIHPELDPMSDEFAAKAMADARTQRARISAQYASRSADLQSQQGELDSQRAQAAQASQMASQPDPSSGGADFLDLLNGTLQMTLMQQQMQSMSRPAAASPSSAGAGGCHPGHDETAHPGGCHDASGGGGLR